MTYLRQKAQNLATKEDIEEITEAQEAIKTELATRSHFSRLRYEREIEIYKEVWRKLSVFYFESDRQHMGGPSLDEYSSARRELGLVIRDNRPFYPNEVRKELIIFQRFVEDLHHIRVGRQMNEEIGRQLMKMPEQVKSQLTKVEEAIRNRLDKFDGA